MKKILSVLSLCVIVSACGFQPMHGNNVNNKAGQMNLRSVLAQVEIANIPDREGQYLRNALIDRFYTNGRPIEGQYILNIGKISESIINLDITKNSDATRAQLRLKASMDLKDKNNGEIVLSRELNSISSYNILTSEFATRVSAQNTRENTLNDLASQIELQIGLYLSRQD